MPLKSETAHLLTREELRAHLNLQLADLSREREQAVKRLKQRMTTHNQSQIEEAVTNLTIEFIKMGEPLREQLKRLG